MNWRKELGSYDEKERLRVTIIRGINKTNPNSYRVVLGVNAGDFRPDIKYAVMISRAQTMEPSSDGFLKGFLNSYRKIGAYFLAPSAQPDDSQSPTLISGTYILKQELNVRDAWEIGPNDLDLVGIAPDDDPIIPEGKQDVPLLQALRERKTTQAE
ncbi:MAG: hypothetical protein WD533_02905 [Dehalococcoidia bacterium]